MYVYGKNVAKDLIKNNKKIHKAIIWENFGDKSLISDLQKLNIPIIYKTKKQIDELANGNHQGIILNIPDYKFADLDDLKPKNNELPFLVMLDHLEDPHNFGAIIRTCESAGVDGIIIPARRNVQVNSTVEKISAGAINHIPIIKVNSLINAVQKLKDNNWWVIATDASAKDNYYDVKYDDMNFAIIMGAEHAGVSKSLLKASDFVVKIPMQNSFNSLNVSNALSAIIFETLRQKLIKKK